MTTAALSRPRALFLPGATRRGFVLGFAGTLIVGLFLLIGLSIGIGIAYGGRIMPGVRVGGVDVAGLDRAAAEARLRDSLPSLAAGHAVVTVDGTPVEVAYEQLGRGYELESMLDAAFAMGRSGNPLTDGLARLRSSFHPGSVQAVVHGYDAAAIDRVVNQIVSQFTTRPVSARATLGTDGYEVTPASPGTTLDASALRSALGDAVSRNVPGTVRVNLHTSPVAPLISTLDADAAAIAARWMTSRDLTLTTADGRFTLGAEAMRGMVGFSLAGTHYGPLVDRSALSDWLSEIAPEVAVTAKDAGFSWDASGVSGVVPAVEGRDLDVNGSVLAVVEALETRARGALLGGAALATTTTEPALTTAAAQAAADKMQRLGTWTTYYVPGTGNYWGANISIPARDLDLMVIAPGDWFDFWDDIGPVTVERGYGYGGAIIGGKSVANGALAGGICSTSTTLFNAAMRAGLEIGDRTNHYYYIERYPLGLDATVFQTDTYEVNMTFRNDTENPIVIRSYTGTGYVRFDIWGVSDGRTVSLSTPIITNRRTARETTVQDNSLRPGTSVRVEYPHNGFDASVTRTVRAANGDVIWQNVWFSHYSVVNGITDVGPEKSKPKPSPSS